MPSLGPVVLRAAMLLVWAGKLMLKVKRTHSHTVLHRIGWLVTPAAIYVHAHEDGDEEHDHESLVKVEAVIAKAEAE